MKFNKIILTSLFLALLLISSPLNIKATQAASLSPTIVEHNYTTPIASGVEHHDIRRFTADGWLSMDVIRIDLNDNYTEIGPLFHPEGLSKRTTVKGLVEQKNAVAGINGDFFNTTHIPTSLGALIHNGEMISSPNNLPTFYITENNEAKIDYMTKNMTIINNTSGRLLTIDTVNKLHVNFETITLLNKHWGKSSIGTQFRGDLYEVLIQDGVVLDRHFGGDPFPIPQNDTGFVLTSKSTNLLDFDIGDRISYSLQSGPDWNSLKFAIGAGGMVLREGVLTNTDVQIKGLHPRTGLGISQDGKEVILVTVDGRDPYFKGVSQETLGAILKNLGAYNGINFDGGGSTMMAVKPLGQANAVVVNKASENRSVVNGVGVFSSAPRGNLNKISLTTKKDSVFIGNSIDLELKAYDEYDNIFNININDLNWSVSDDLGIVSNGVFVANKPGIGTITASYNNISASTPVRVLGYPIDVNKDTLNKAPEIIEGGFKIAVYNEPEITGNTLFTKIISTNRLTNLTERLSTAALGIQMKNINDSFKSLITHSQVVDGKSIFGTSEKESIYTINLQADSVGIRSAGSKQWVDLVETLDTVENKNIIITINKPVFGSAGFSDKMEADLFQDVLEKAQLKGKDIFVIQNGNANDLEIKEGIRYFTLNAAKISTPEQMSNYSFIEFTVNGEDISYQRVYPYSLR